MDNKGLRLDSPTLILLRCLAKGTCVPSVEAERALYAGKQRSQGAARAQILLLRRRIAKSAFDVRVVTTWFDSRNVGWTLIGPDVPEIQKLIETLDNPRDVLWVSRRLESAAKDSTTFKPEYEEATRQLLADAARLIQRIHLTINAPPESA